MICRALNAAFDLPLLLKAPLARVAALAVGVAAFAAVAPVSAQLADTVDRAQLQDWRMAQGNVIRFCQFGSGQSAGFHRAIGEAIADRLLLHSEFTVLGTGFGVDGEYLEAELYTALVNNCEVILGMRVESDMYAPDFTVTRPYVSFEYLMLAVEDGFDRIEDIPRDRRLGSPIASYGDFALAQFIAVRPAGDRWLRLPYGNVNLMLDRLLDGTIAAMTIYGPVLTQLSQERPEDVARLRRLVTNANLAAPSNIGGLMLARNVFLRMEVDQALDDMIADGTITEILDESGFGEIPARPGGA